jgi:uncharacterized membrane protein
MMSVAFDLTTLILVFAIIRDLTNQRMAALLGALLYGVFPMQVIYSDFMRTYTLSNLLCALVIWLSLRAETPPLVALCDHWGSCRVGCGYSLSGRSSFSVPCALVLFQGYAAKEE